MAEEPTSKKDHSKDFDLLVKQMRAIGIGRARAILLVCYIETYLGEALLPLLPGLNHKLRAKLFDPEGVLGPIIARADLAKALNLISATQHGNIKTLASIRNKFAHHIDITHFDHPEIAKRVANLVYDDSPTFTPAQLRDRAEKFQALATATKFETVAFELCIALHNLLDGE